MTLINESQAKSLAVAYGMYIRSTDDTADRNQKWCGAYMLKAAQDQCGVEIVPDYRLVERMKLFHANNK